MLILVLVLALDIQAFQQITSGISANMNGAYWTVAMSVVVLGGVLAWLRMPDEKKTTTTTTAKPKKKAKKKK